MAKDIFKSKKKEEDPNASPIPNSQVYFQFTSIASDDQMFEFNKLIDKGLVSTASAYASHRVNKTFNHWRDNFIKEGGDLDWLQWNLYRKNK